jgi:hypothetical protein
VNRSVRFAIVSVVSAGALLLGTASAAWALKPVDPFDPADPPIVDPPPPTTSTTTTPPHHFPPIDHVPVVGVFDPGTDPTVPPATEPPTTDPTDPGTGGGSGSGSGSGNGSTGNNDTGHNDTGTVGTQSGDGAGGGSANSGAPNGTQEKAVTVERDNAVQPLAATSKLTGAKRSVSKSSPEHRADEVSTNSSDDGNDLLRVGVGAAFASALAGGLLLFVRRRRHAV